MAFKSPRQTPEVGSVFEHIFQGALYTMEVVQSPDGVGYMVGGIVFKSPTAAAKFVVGKEQFINGWRFWHMDDPKPKRKPK